MQRSVRSIAIAATLVLAACQAAVARPPDGIGAVLALTSALAQSISPTSEMFRSVRLQAKTPTFAGYAVLDFAHDRELFVTSRRAVKSVAYVAGNVIYDQAPNGEWVKLDLARGIPAASRAPRAVPFVALAHKRMLPDRIVGAKRMGVLSFDVPGRAIDAQLPPSLTVTVTCLYDKAGGRPSSCSAPNVLQMSFDRYDDPRNAVRIPPEALNARAFDFGATR